MVCGVDLKNKSIGAIVKLSFCLSMFIILVSAGLGAFYLGIDAGETDACYPGGLVGQLDALKKSDFSDKEELCNKAAAAGVVLTAAVDDDSKQAKEGYYSYQLMKQTNGPYTGGLTQGLAGALQCEFYKKDNDADATEAYCRQRPFPADECGKVELVFGRLEAPKADKCKARKVPQICKKTGILEQAAGEKDNVDILVTDQENAAFLGMLVLGVTLIAVLHLAAAGSFGFCAGYCVLKEANIDRICGLSMCPQLNCCAEDGYVDNCLNGSGLFNLYGFFGITSCFWMCNENNVADKYKYKYEASALQFVSLVCEVLIIIAGAALFDINTNIENICFLSADANFNGGVTARAHITRDGASDTEAYKNLIRRDEMVNVFEALFIALCITSGIKLAYNVLVSAFGDKDDLDNNYPEFLDMLSSFKFWEGPENGILENIKQNMFCCLFAPGSVGSYLGVAKENVDLRPRRVQLRGTF